MDVKQDITETTKTTATQKLPDDRLKTLQSD